MKFSVRWLSLLVAVTFLLSLVSVFPFGAASASEATNSGSSDKRKIVSVVFDNSGSMNSNKKFNYAKYALQTLMTMLDDDDILYVTPMNGQYSETSILADFSLENRGINDILNKVQSSRDGTPAGSMDVALKRLTSPPSAGGVKLYEGLKNDANAGLAAEDEEYWLIILTDGEFSDGVQAESGIRQRIADYSSLKTIYINFVDGANLTNSKLQNEFAFQAYHAENGAELAEEMQKIANHLTSRYTLPASYYTVNGSTVTLSLMDYDPSFRNIAVIAQNSSAELVSVKYNGKSVFSGSDADKKASKYCQIVSDSSIGMKAGCSAVIAGDPYFLQGVLTFEFAKSGSANVDLSHLTFLAEPALELDTYFVQGGKELTMQDVNSTCKPGTKIKVGYRVKDQATGNVINLGKIFPNATIVSKATYSGNTYSMTYHNAASSADYYGVTDSELPLVLGNKDIFTSITIRTNTYEYSIYDSAMCLIMAEPTDFRVESVHPTGFSGGEASLSYDVYVDNVKRSPDELRAAGYTWEITVTDPNNQKAVLTATEDNAAKSFGAICKETKALYGSYTVLFKIRASTGISRENTCVLTSVLPLNSMTLRCLTSEDALKLGTASATVEFELLSEGRRLTPSEIASYDLKAVLTACDAEEKALTPEVTADGIIKVTLAIADNLYGDYKTTLSVSKGTDEELSSVHVYKVHPDVIRITGDHADAIAKGETKATASYRIQLDGVTLTAEDLKHYPWELITYAPGGTEYRNEVTVDPDGTVRASFDVAGAGYGVYENKLIFKINEDVGEEYSHRVKNYPSDFLIRVVGTDKLTLTRHQLSDNTEPLRFELTSSDAPFVFDNGITEVKVLVGDQDVTNYVHIDGNILTYAPQEAHFKESLSLGEHTVTVLVDCPELPSLSTSASAVFSIDETVYSIISLEDTNKKIERFRLGEIDAAIHFQVLRDGVLLSLEELEAAYASGELSVIDEKGSFSKLFWMPCKNEITVKSVNGQAVLEYRVVRGYSVLALDKVMAMFYLTGDRPICVSYMGVEYRDAIAIQRGAPWVYLLIWFILFFIVHVILFVIGFFNGKCKNLPTGVFASIDMKGRDGQTRSFDVDKRINMTFSEKWLWHLGRFTLVGCFRHKKLWYHQPSVRVSAYNLTFGYDANGLWGISFKEENVYRVTKYENRTQGYELFTQFEDELSSYNPRKSKAPSVEIVVRDLKSIFRVDAGEAQLTPNDFLSNRFYGIVSNKSKNLELVIMFVEQY